MHLYPDTTCEIALAMWDVSGSIATQNVVLFVVGQYQSFLELSINIAVFQCVPLSSYLSTI